MGSIPVTSPLRSATVTLPLLKLPIVFTIVRHPRTSEAVILVQFREPINNGPWDPIDMRSWRPSAITSGVVFVIVKELASITLNRPQLVAAVVVPDPVQSFRGASGVPAT